MAQLRPPPSWSPFRFVQQIATENCSVPGTSSRLGVWQPRVTHSSEERQTRYRATAEASAVIGTEGHLISDLGKGRASQGTAWKSEEVFAAGRQRGHQTEGWHKHGGRQRQRTRKPLCRGRAYPVEGQRQPRLTRTKPVWRVAALGEACSSLLTSRRTQM